MERLRSILIVRDKDLALCLFGQGRYLTWYEGIVSSPISAGGEVHHIVPRSLGGSDDQTNLVRLSYRQHFLAHWILTKITVGFAQRKMAHALKCLVMDNGLRTRSAWQYDVVKKAMRDVREDKIRAAKKRLSDKPAPKKLTAKQEAARRQKIERVQRVKAARFADRRKGQKQYAGWSLEQITESELTALQNRVRSKTELLQ